MKYLLISEKPSLMREVQKVYSRSKFSKNNDVDFIPLHGHVCTLEEPQGYDKKYEQWNVEDLPILPERDFGGYKHIAVDKELTKEIKKKIKEGKYDGLINCTDPEREGQNIFYSLYDFLGLKLPVLRFWVEDLTEDKLIKSWDSMVDDLKDKKMSNLTSAALLRAQADWDIGMNGSRALRIAVGRVMSATLCILAKREEEIKNFVPETTYNIFANYREGFSGKYIPNKDKEETGGAFKKKEDAEKFIKEILTSDQAIIDKYESKTVKENAPLLYSTSELQADANKNFGYTANQTLEIVESLYNAPLAILTYPRTDSNYITKAMAKEDFGKILKACVEVPELSDINYSYDSTKYMKSRYVDDSKVEAHAAITLTGKSFNFNNLKTEQQNILTLVAKRCLATVMDSAEYIDTSIEALVKEKHLFKTKEKILVKPGFLTLYGKDVESGTDFSKLKEGYKLGVNEFIVKDTTTTPPSRYNDGTLLRAMVNVGNTIEDEELRNVLKGTGSKDQGGIGTPATRAAIIDKLCIDRKNGDKKEPWVKRKGKSFVVTDFGMKIANIVGQYSIGSAVLTAEWEKKLGDIAKGTFDPKVFRKELDQYIIEEVEKMKGNRQSSSSSKSSAMTLDDVTCPHCGGKIKVTDRFYLCENYGKEDDKCKFIIKTMQNEAKIKEEDIKDLCNGKETRTMKMKSKDGKKAYSVKLKASKETGKIDFVFDNTAPSGTATKLVHSQDGGQVVKKEGQFGVYYECTKCKARVSEKYREHKFTQKELKGLYNGEKIGKIEDFKSKEGKIFPAFASLEDGKIKLNFN